MGAELLQKKAEPPLCTQGDVRKFGHGAPAERGGGAEASVDVDGFVVEVEETSAVLAVFHEGEFLPDPGKAYASAMRVSA